MKRGSFIRLSGSIFMTGMRVSEGLSLKWSDIDLKNKVIHIQSTLEYQGNGKYVRKEQTKN